MTRAIMGLTTTDLGYSFLNTAGYAAVGFGGIAAAYLTSFIFMQTLRSRLLAFLVGAAAGIATTYYAVKYAPHHVLPDQKALKFLLMFAIGAFGAFRFSHVHNPHPIISLLKVVGGVIMLTSIGGMFAHIGREQFLIWGCIGGIGSIGAAAASVTGRFSSSSDDYKPSSRQDY